jgi:hypothetical protein
MQVLETFGNQWNIAGTDLEETVAAEGTSLTALQGLRLRLGDGTKEIVRAIEDARVRFIVRSF